jgi:flagellar hook-length control protein FliK
VAVAIPQDAIPAARNEPGQVAQSSPASDAPGPDVPGVFTTPAALARPVALPDRGVAGQATPAWGKPAWTAASDPAPQSVPANATVPGLTRPASSATSTAAAPAPLEQQVDVTTAAASDQPPSGSTPDAQSALQALPADIAVGAAGADDQSTSPQPLDAARLRQRISTLDSFDAAPDLAKLSPRMAAGMAARFDASNRGDGSLEPTLSAAAAAVFRSASGPSIPAAGAAVAVNPAGQAMQAAQAGLTGPAASAGETALPPTLDPNAPLASVQTGPGTDAAKGGATAATRPVPSFAFAVDAPAEPPTPAAAAAFTRAFARASASDWAPTTVESTSSRNASLSTLPVTGVASTLMNDAPHAAVVVDPPAVAVTSVPIDDHALGQQIVQGIRLQWQGGVGQATIQLHPEHLGSVTVSLKVEGQSVSADIHAETSTAQQWIATHESELRSGLEKHGLSLERFTVRQEEQQQQQPDRRFARQQQRRRQDQPRQSRRTGGPTPTFEIAA